MVETVGRDLQFTTFSAKRRTVTGRPAGAGEQAKAVNRASKAPSKVILGGRVRDLRSKAASSFFDETLF